MTDTPARPIRLYTVPEVADQLKVSQKQVRRWIASSELVAHRLAASCASPTAICGPSWRNEGSSERCPVLSIK